METLAPFLPLVMLPMFLLSVAWYVGVIVMLVKIWNKVKRLP